MNRHGRAVDGLEITIGCLHSTALSFPATLFFNYLELTGNVPFQILPQPDALDSYLLNLFPGRVDVHLQVAEGNPYLFTHHIFGAIANQPAIVKKPPLVKYPLVTGIS